MFHKNVLRRYGLKKSDQRTDYFYSVLHVGEPAEIFREAKILNRKTRKLGDRKYFVWPVGGLLTQAMLVVGRRKM